VKKEMVLFHDIKGCEQLFGNLDLKQIEILALQILKPGCRQYAKKQQQSLLLPSKLWWARLLEMKSNKSNQ